MHSVCNLAVTLHRFSVRWPPLVYVHDRNRSWVSFSLSSRSRAHTPTPLTWHRNEVFIIRNPVRLLWHKQECYQKRGTYKHFVRIGCHLCADSTRFCLDRTETRYTCTAACMALSVDNLPSTVTGNFMVVNLTFYKSPVDCLCGLVVRVSGYRYRGPGFDPRRYQIFWVAVGLERGPLSLVSLMRSIEELLEWKK